MWANLSWSSKHQDQSEESLPAATFPPREKLSGQEAAVGHLRRRLLKSHTNNTNTNTDKQTVLLP